MDRSKTNKAIYWKPIITATPRSLVLAGKQAINSYIYDVCGVLMVEDLKELVIYIRDMTAEELAACESPFHDFG